MCLLQTKIKLDIFLTPLYFIYSVSLLFLKLKPFHHQTAQGISEMFVSIQKGSMLEFDKVSATTGGRFVVDQSREGMEGLWKCETVAPQMSSVEKDDYNFVYNTQVEVQS